MTAPSIPPCLDPARAKPVSRHEARYRAHLTRIAPELVQHAAEASYDRTLRACMLMLRELREARLDRAECIETSGELVAEIEAQETGEMRR